MLEDATFLFLLRYGSGKRLLGQSLQWRHSAKNEEGKIPHGLLLGDIQKAGINQGSLYQISRLRFFKRGVPGELVELAVALPC